MAPSPKKISLNYLLKNFEEILCAGFLVFMVGLVITNVLLRYFLSYSIYWAEEVSTICFVWLVFLGASATYKHKMDIGIDVLVLKTSKKMQRYIRASVDALLLVLNGYIFFMAIMFTRFSFEKPTAVLGVSSAVLNLALVFGFGLITLHTLRFIGKDLGNALSAEGGS